MTQAGAPAGRRAAVAGAIVIGLLGCGAVLRDRGEGRLEATWTGAEKGRMAGPASAVWCHAAQIGQVTALQGDTGVGLVIHALDTLAAGRYPVFEPANSRATAPSATLALRLLSRTAVVGYQGRGGTVTVDRVDRARISGRFDAKASIATAVAGTISLNGRFLDVPIARGGPECPP